MPEILTEMKCSKCGRKPPTVKFRNVLKRIGKPILCDECFKQYDEKKNGDPEEKSDKGNGHGRINTDKEVQEVSTE